MIRVDSWLHAARVKPAGYRRVMRPEYLNLETSVLTGASLEQGRRDLPSKAGRDYPVGLR